jgi:hypothetical protein
MYAMGMSAAAVNVAWMAGYGRGSSTEAITQEGNRIAISTRGMLGHEESSFIINDMSSVDRKESRRKKGHFNETTLKWDGDVLVATIHLAVEGKVSGCSSISISAINSKSVCLPLAYTLPLPFPLSQTMLTQRWLVDENRMILRGSALDGDLTGDTVVTKTYTK